jgi:hypothetical protein
MFGEPFPVVVPAEAIEKSDCFFVETGKDSSVSHFSLLGAERPSISLSARSYLPEGAREFAPYFRILGDQDVFMRMSMVGRKSPARPRNRISQFSFVHKVSNR